MNRASPSTASVLRNEVIVAGKRCLEMSPWNSVGPSRMPARISPSTGGWPIALDAAPSSRASSRITATARKAVAV
jgi:hypothetical protein